MSEPRIYGVSYGNGNDGVSQLYPDFYVTTDKPYRLALAAMIDQFKPEFMAQAKEACTVEGEADYTISATIFDPLDEEPDADDPDAPTWCDVNGAWKIAEVFPVEPDEVRDSKPSFESLEEAISPQALALTAREAE